jgi:hypothetical protein
MSASPENEKDIMDRNPLVDRKIVRQFSSLEAELRKIGVDVRPKYRLLPPLGTGPANLATHSSVPDHDSISD